MNILIGAMTFATGVVIGFILCCCGFLRMLTGTLLIDRSKEIDICRIELEKEISGKYSLFENKYVNDLESATRTYSIVEGGNENG